MNIGIITGASSGMGKEFVKLTMQNHLDLDEIWVIARRKERLEAWPSLYKEQKFRILPLDLQKKEDVECLKQILEETQPHIDGMINRIHAKGVKAGIALKPSTPLSTVEYVLDKCDSVLLMLINPGYAFLKVEKQVAYADSKIRQLRQMINERGLDTKIELDGRISPDNIRTYGKDLADVFVTGTTCLDRNDLSGSFARLEQLRREIL